MNVPEKNVQALCLNYLKGHDKVAWAERMNTGAARIKNPGSTKDRFVKFAFRGCPDIIGQLTDGRFLAVEVKKYDGKPAEKKLSEHQKAFLELVEKHNGAAFVTDSLDDLEWFMIQL